MFRCGFQPFQTADDVRDLHQMIVNHVRQVVGRVLVRLEDHEIRLGQCEVHANLAFHQIVELDLLVVHAKADRVRHALGQILVDLLLAQLSAAVIVADHGTILLRLISEQLQQGLVAEAPVGQTLLEQLVGILFVEFGSLRLVEQKGKNDACD